MFPINFFKVIDSISEFEHNNFYSLLSYYFSTHSVHTSTRYTNSGKYLYLSQGAYQHIFISRNNSILNYNINNPNNITKIIESDEYFNRIQTRLELLITFTELKEFNVSLVSMLYLNKIKYFESYTSEYKLIIYDYIHFLYEYFSKQENIDRHLEIIINIILEYNKSHFSHNLETHLGNIIVFTDNVKIQKFRIITKDNITDWFNEIIKERLNEYKELITTI